MTDAMTDRGSARVGEPPIATPWILGLYGLAGATFIVAAHMAHWYGGAESAKFLFPLAAVLGGLIPLLAAMWAYETRDALATAMLGTWGAFWIGYGILNALFAMGRLSQPAGDFPELGFWFIAVAAITWMGAVTALADSGALVAVFGLFAAGATVAALGDLMGLTWLMILAGWLFIIGAVCAWYTATAIMLDEACGREVLPLGRSGLAAETPRLEQTGPLGHTPATHHAG